MESKDLLPVLEANLARQLHWIASSDSKSAFIFSVTAAMLGLLAAVAPADPAQWKIAPSITTVFTVVSAAASLAFLSFAAFPKTDGPKGSLVYCGGVAHRHQSHFCDQILSASYDTYAKDLAAQCHRNAVIASEKFKWIQRSMIALYVSIAPWALSVWLLYSASK